MKSKLNINEFRNRLKENSKIGYPKLKSTPFVVFTMSGGGGSKVFFGMFDDSTFRLTMNSTLFPTFYIIKGKYKNINNSLNVNYTIEPNSKFQILWNKYLPIISLFGVNLFFLLNSRKIPVEVYLAFNLFIIFMILFSRWDIKRKKKNLEQKFIKIFEITQ